MVTVQPDHSQAVVRGLNVSQVSIAVPLQNTGNLFFRLWREQGGATLHSEVIGKTGTAWLQEFSLRGTGWKVQIISG